MIHSSEEKVILHMVSDRRIVCAVTFSAMAITSLWVAVVSAQPRTPPAAAVTAHPSEMAWITEEWTGDDQPYKRIRAQIDQAMADGRSVVALAHEYKMAAGKKLGDPEVQFRWAYAAYLEPIPIG